MVISGSGKHRSQVLIQDYEIHTATSLSSQIPIETGQKEGRKKVGEQGDYNSMKQKRKGATVNKSTLWETIQQLKGPGRHIHTDGH